MTSQILVFHQPRSGVHLLLRLLGSGQERVSLLEDPFTPTRASQAAWLLQETCMNGMSETEQDAFASVVDDGVKVWREAIEAAKPDRIVMFKAYSFAPVAAETLISQIRDVEQQSFTAPTKNAADNYSMLPSELLLRQGTVPVFLIRDPRITVPSTYRTLKSMGLQSGGGRPFFIVAASIHWSRLLFDYYTANGLSPLVVEADDIMTDANFTRSLATRLGLDPNKLKFTWPAASEEEKRDIIHPSHYLSQHTLIDSTGVDESLATCNRDLDAEMAGWETEYGDNAGLLRDVLERARPNYAYLLQKRWRP